MISNAQYQNANSHYITPNYNNNNNNNNNNHNTLNKSNSPNHESINLNDPTTHKMKTLTNSRNCIQNPTAKPDNNNMTKRNITAYTSSSTTRIKKPKETNKKLSNILRININPVINHSHHVAADHTDSSHNHNHPDHSDNSQYRHQYPYYNNKSFNIDMLNSIALSPSYSPNSTTRTKRSPNQFTFMMNYYKNMSHDLENFKPKPVKNISLSRVFTKKKKSTKSIIKIPTSRRNDEDLPSAATTTTAKSTAKTNNGPKHMSKKSLFHKTHTDLSLINKECVHRIQKEAKYNQNSESIPRKRSRYLSNSPSTSIAMANLRKSSRENKQSSPESQSNFNLVPFHTPMSSYRSINGDDDTARDFPLEEKQQHQPLKYTHNRAKPNNQKNSIGNLPIARELIYFKGKLISNTNSQDDNREEEEDNNTSVNNMNIKKANFFLEYKSPGSSNARSSTDLFKNNVNKNLAKCYLGVLKPGNDEIHENSLPYKNNVAAGIMNTYQKEEKSDKNIDNIMRTLCTEEDCGVEILDDIRMAFDSILDNDLIQLANSQNNLMNMKKIKQAYEKYIENLQKNHINDEKKTIIEENTRLKEQNALLMQKNLVLQANLDEITKDPLRYCNPSSNQTSTKLCISPCKPEFNSEKSESHTEKPESNTEKPGSNLEKFGSSIEKKQIDLDTPPITNITDKSQKAYLKQIITNQQYAISMLKKKEAKMIRILYAVKKKGIDIEKIYNQEVKGIYQDSSINTGFTISSGGGDNRDIPSAGHDLIEEYDLPTIDKMKKNVIASIHNGDSGNNMKHEDKQVGLISNGGSFHPSVGDISRKRTIEVIESQILTDHKDSLLKCDPKEKESFIDSENPSTDGIASGYTRHQRNMSDMRSITMMNNTNLRSPEEQHAQISSSISPSHSNLKPELKNKLKLDLTTLKKSLSPSISVNPEGNSNFPCKSKLMMSNLNNKNQNDEDAPQPLIGFHEEFMSKFEEFSLSWRQAALNERNL